MAYFFVLVRCYFVCAIGECRAHTHGRMHFVIINLCTFTFTAIISSGLVTHVVMSATRFFLGHEFNQI